MSEPEICFPLLPGESVCSDTQLLGKQFLRLSTQDHLTGKGRSPDSHHILSVPGVYGVPLRHEHHPHFAHGESEACPGQSRNPRLCRVHPPTCHEEASDSPSTMRTVRQQSPRRARMSVLMAEVGWAGLGWVRSS